MTPVYSAQRRTPIARSAAEGTSGIEEVEGRIDDGGQHVILPLAIDLEVRRRKAFDVETRSSEHRRASHVARHVVGGNSVQPPLLERVGDCTLHGFGHVALALVVTREVVAENARLEGAAMYLGQIEVADDRL